MAVAHLVAIASSSNVQSAVLFCLVLVLTIAWVRGRGPPNLPPGPLALPIIGNALGLLKAGQIHRVFTSWAQRYGPITRVWLGPHLAIILNDVKVVKEALVNQADCFSDRIAFVELKGSIALSSGEVCNERRRFIMSALRTLGMGKRSVEHRINEEAHHLLESLDGEGGRPFNPAHVVMNAVSNIICTISFGYRFEYTDAKFARLVEGVQQIMQNVSFASMGNKALEVFLGLFRKRTNEDRDTVAKISKFIKEIVTEHEESFDPNNIRDIVDMILAEIERLEKSGKATDVDSAFCRTTMWAVIYDLFNAGTDTTSNSLLWLILYMVLNPDVQRKMQAEIDDVIGGHRQPAISDRDNMPYTNAVLMEVLRIRPVAAFGMPHCTHCKTELNGYTIPAKTVVFVNVWGIFQDPVSWKDPEKFDPSRFLSEDGKTVEKPEAFIPFSLGRRVCLGESLAKMELFLFSVNLLQRFTLALPTGTPAPAMDGIAGINLHPRTYHITATKR